MLVLLVDDDPMHGQIVQHLLETSGINCLYAESSEEAIKLLDRPIDLVVQDVARGDDGHAGLSLYHSHLEKLELPTIFLTAFTEKQLTLPDAKCFYMSKPPRNEELVNKIREVLNPTRQDETGSCDQA